MKKTVKVGFISLGCSKNLVDTEVMLKLLADQGYEITADETEADVVVINTCAFIESAKQEAIDNILDVAWLKKHRSLKGIVVTGCLAERYGQDIVKDLPEVDAVVGVGSLHEIGQAVEKAYHKKKFYSCNDKNASPLGGDRLLLTPAYTAYLKIAEGCDNCCTYCAIPAIRGRFRSRPIEDLVKEAKELEALGVKELNIVAQDTSRYGLDLYGEYALAKLVRAITEATNIPWLRLIYCYPDKITEELIEEFRENPRLVKYIDLPIQHINERVLKKMNRHGGRDVILDAIRRLREGVPGISIRTTAIVGFPGETEEEFEELCQFIKEAKFEHFGAFPYSAEEGTPAASFPDQIDEQTKSDRYDIIMQTQNAVVERLLADCVGREVTVLVEGYDPAEKMYFGRQSTDAPDIDGKVFFSLPSQGEKADNGKAPRAAQATRAARNAVEIGSFVTVRITEPLDYDLKGVLVEKEPQA